ncbi:MAG: lysophospholipid acyltransferase family protein [Candidatus Tyrphobacter sp.]
MTLYGFSKAAIHGVALLLWRVRARGTENVPREGALIIACNHVSLLDPPVLGAFCPRTIHYMAKAELFAVPILGSLIRALGAYPVVREGSAAGAIKRSVEMLRRGEAIGIFPEGGRNVLGDAPIRRGVALLASLTGAPVLPAAIVGSRDAYRLERIAVIFGTPRRIEGERATREELAKFADAVMEEVHALALHASVSWSQHA